MPANSLYQTDIVGDAGSPATVSPFRPRAVNEARKAALQWLAKSGAGVSPRAQHVGRALARHASVARYNVPWRHIQAGKLVAFVSINTLAREIGRNRSTVERGLTELVCAGLVKHRTFRTTTYVFPEPADLPSDLPADLPADLAADLAADPKGRSEEPSDDPMDEAAEERDANPPPPVGVHERAKQLVSRYRRELYPTHRGNPYRPSFVREEQDLKAAHRLCELFDDDELEMVVVYFLRIPDKDGTQFVPRKTRSLTWCLGLAQRIGDKLKLKGRGQR